jgi:hypothetical protein
MSAEAIISCVVSDWETTQIEPSDWFICSLEVGLYNERPSSTKLSSLCAEFFLDGEQRSVSRLRRPPSDQEDSSALNLPPQQWTHARLYTTFEGEEGLTLAGFQRSSPWRVDLVGYLPDGEELRQKIVERKNFFTSHYKKPFVHKGYAHLLPRSQVISTTLESAVMSPEENRLLYLFILMVIGGMTLLAAGYSLFSVLFAG